MFTDSSDSMCLSPIDWETKFRLFSEAFDVLEYERFLGTSSGDSKGVSVGGLKWGERFSGIESSIMLLSGYACLSGE